MDNFSSQTTPASAATPGTPTISGGVAASSTAPRFDIPEMIQKTYPDLIELILQTESMNDEERQYWFHMIPVMTGEQVKKLRTILANEREQLKKLDQEYESELIQLNEKHTTAWKAEEIREKREQMKKAESQHEEEEKKAEEILLNKLGDI